MQYNFILQVAYLVLLTELEQLSIMNNPCLLMTGEILYPYCMIVTLAVMENDSRSHYGYKINQNWTGNFHMDFNKYFFFI